jgi:hypothetical protein
MVHQHLGHQMKLGCLKYKTNVIKKLAKFVGGGNDFQAGHSKMNVILYYNFLLFDCVEI